MTTNPSSSNPFFIDHIDKSKLDKFMMRAVEDMASSLGAMMIILGDRLGLYKAMAKIGPITSDNLSTHTNTSERYIREWLASQAAAGYVSYNSADCKYSLSPENAMVLADENSPYYIMGSYQILRSIFKDEDKFVDLFKNGYGLRWGEHHHDLFEGTAKFFKSNYIGNLLSSWIPSLDGVDEKLRKGGKVADIGCGYGVSTILMAKEYTNSKFFGFDNHEYSINAAKQQAINENILDRVEFIVVNSCDDSIGNNYDLITFFDCLHDMANPVDALKFAKQSMKQDGTCMVVEPMANDNIVDNFNLIGKMYYSASTLICVPNSLADNGVALGAQAGENKIKEIAKIAGFSKFKRSSQTPFNIVYELKI
ncbi:MAG TPA: methyltransferase domain-containing protein [Candidatus Nitrosocosmicus sp.]